jgi:hypothetical protein
MQAAMHQLMVKVSDKRRNEMCTWYDISYIIHDIFFTAIWLTPGGSSTVDIYTKTVHRTTNRHKQYIEQHN